MDIADIAHIDLSSIDSLQGGISVIQHTPMATIIGFHSIGITGDIAVLQHCRNIKEFYGSFTSITGDITVLANS